MDGVHVVDECLHCLVYAGNSLVDSVLHDALISAYEVKWLCYIILNLSVVEV